MPEENDAKNLFTLTTGRLPANTRIQANTWEMHIWPTAGLWERSNRANIQFLQREMRGDVQVDVLDPLRLHA